MGDEKKLKVIIFEDDETILKRFKGVFSFEGHDVLSYVDASTCPLFSDTQCDCPTNSPCADVLIADMKMESMTGLEFFELQRKKGCKTPDGNKLLIVGDLTPEQQRAVRSLGCRFIKKPFNEYEIAKWMELRARTVTDEALLIIH